MSTAPPLTLNAWLRYDLIQRFLRELDDQVASVVEIGAGEGSLAVRLAGRYDYVGVEPDPLACARAQERLREVGRGRMICGDASALDPGATFDLLCALEVLEHIEDDVATLGEWRRLLRAGGWVLVSAPGRPEHFGAADRMVGHYRRYDPARMAEVLIASGFAEPVVLQCGFPLGYALEAARNAAARLTARSHESQSLAERSAASGRRLQPPEQVGWLTAGIAAPFRLLQRPFVRRGPGTGLVALARRP